MPLNQIKKLLPKTFKKAFFFALIFISSLSQVFASSQLETAQSDYNFQYTKLRDSYGKHTNTLIAFQTFRTASAKEQAFQNSRQFLVQTSTLYRSYSSFIEAYINTFNWDNNQNYYDEIISKLNNINTYFQTLEEKAGNAKTLEEISVLANDTSKDINQNFNPDIDKILAIFEFINTSNLFDQFQKISKSLTQNQPNTTIKLNWQAEIDDISKKAQIYLTQTKEKLDGMKSGGLSAGNLQGVTTSAGKVKTELKRSKTLFLEFSKL